MTNQIFPYDLDVIGRNKPSNLDHRDARLSPVDALGFSQVD